VRENCTVFKIEIKHGRSREQHCVQGLYKARTGERTALCSRLR